MIYKYINGLCVLIILFLIIGCAQVQEEAPAEETEEFVDTGVLAIESSPSDAEAYVDDELKGNTPLTLYNFPAGVHNIAIKKQGYFDFEKRVVLAVGRTEEVSATLKPLKSAAEEKEEEPEITPPPAPKVNKINLSKFALYYDLDNNLFTEIRAENSDLFSRTYDKYVHFTSITPARIKLIEKPLKDAQQVDCIAAEYGVAQLYSGQTLCVISAEGATFAISGTWEAVPTELEFVKLG